MTTLIPAIPLNTLLMLFDSEEDVILMHTVDMCGEKDELDLHGSVKSMRYFANDQGFVVVNIDTDPCTGAFRLWVRRGEE